MLENAPAKMSARTRSVRIVVISPSPVRLGGLSILLTKQPDFLVVAGYSDASQVGDMAARTHADVIVVDHRGKSQPNARELAAALRSAPAVRVIYVTDNPTRERIVQLIEQGAHGIVAQDAPSEVLFKSVRCVADGEYWIGRERISDVMDVLRRKRRSTANEVSLTLKEQEIIYYIVRGFSYLEIANQLNVSSQAVRHRLSRIFAKLGVSNRLELMLFALDRRIGTDE